MNISQIAKLAGVSPAAVSRFLNDGYLSEEKKKAIATVIEETGYVPSTQAQTLRTKKSKVIGVIIPKIDSDSISQVVAGISEVLNQNGYQMLLATTENDEKKELEYINTFKQNIVDGIILLGTIITPAHKTALKNLNIPVVILGQQSDFATCVYHDDYTSALELTRYVIQKGYKHLGYIGVPKNDIAVGNYRMMGFLDAVKEADLSVPDSAIEVGSFSKENGYENAKKIIDNNAEVNILICATDTIALGAIEYLHEQDILIPKDIAIAGFGDSKASSILNPSLTTVHYFYRESGLEGAKLLLDKIKNPDNPNKSIKLGFDLVKNKSV